MNEAGTPSGAWMTRWVSDHVQILDIQLGAVERCVSASASRMRRQVYAKDCPITGPKTDGFMRGSRTDVVIYERNSGDILWKSNTNKIGEIWITNYILISLFACPEVFNFVWRRGATPDGAVRDMQVTYLSNYLTDDLFVFPVTRFAISDVDPAAPY